MDTPAGNPANAAEVDFQAYAEVLKLQTPRPTTLPDEEIASDLILVDAVYQHYLAHRPEPDSFPSMALQVITLLGREDVDIQKLSLLVSRDPGMTAALLRVANTALYLGVQRVTSVREAITRMGLNEAGWIAGAAAAKSLFSSQERLAQLPFAAVSQDIYINAVTCAVTAGWVSMKRPPAQTDRCYLGGLLHNIGRSIALHSAAALHANGLVELTPKSARLHRVLDSLQSPIGTDALRLWQLPEFVIAIAANPVAPTPDSEPEQQIVSLVSALQLLRTDPDRNPGAATTLLMGARALNLMPPALQTIDLARKRFEALANSLAAA